MKSEAMRADTASRWMNAPASRIYEAFATAAAMEQWLPPDGMSGEMLAFDFREGGFYRMRLRYTAPHDAPGKTSEDADEVAVRLVRLAVNRRIEQSITFESDDPRFAGVMRMSWDFEPLDQGTRVTVRCENVPVGISAQDHEAGLQSSLANLARFVEADRT